MFHDYKTVSNLIVASNKCLLRYSYIGNHHHTSTSALMIAGSMESVQTLSKCAFWSISILQLRGDPAERISNMHKYANFVNNRASEMEFGMTDGRDDGEYDGIGFVWISIHL